MNKYYQRNYSENQNFYTESVQHFHTGRLDTSFSDGIYDLNKGVSTFVVKNPPLEDGTVYERVISDVEICMSNHPSVTSFFSQEHRRSLYNTIMGLPKSPKPIVNMSDEELLRSVVPQYLERDEVKHAINQRFGNLQNFLAQQAQLNPEFSDPDSPESKKSVSVES